METQKNTAVFVRLKDNVTYQCHQCGQCCRHIEHGVMVESIDAYQHAQTERNGAAVEQAFESGYQTATQMIVAGLNSYPVQKGGKNVE